MSESNFLGDLTISEYNSRTFAPLTYALDVWTDKCKSIRWKRLPQGLTYLSRPIDSIFQIGYILTTPTYRHGARIHYVIKNSKLGPNEKNLRTSAKCLVVGGLIVCSVVYIPLKTLCKSVKIPFILLSTA